MVNDNKVSIFVKLNLSKTYYSTEEYFALKDMYEKIVDAKNSYIEIEKSNP